MFLGDSRFELADDERKYTETSPTNGKGTNSFDTDTTRYMEG